MSLNNTYQDVAPANSIEGARGMQYDSVRKLAFISGQTDDSLTAINYTNPESLTVYGSVTDSAPAGSIDGIWFGTLYNGVFFGGSATDDQTSWYNVTTGTFRQINSTAVDVAPNGSQEEIRDVVVLQTAGVNTTWMVTAGFQDDEIATFNISNMMVPPAVVGSLVDTAGACSTDGVHDLYNIPGTTLVIAASNVDSYITVLNISTAGVVTCLGSGYTDTVADGSIEALQQVTYEPSTGYLYVVSPTDGYLSILSAVAGGTPTLVGTVGGLLSPISVSIGTVGTQKFAFVGSNTAGKGITVVNVTLNTTPTIHSVFNTTSGSCLYNQTHSSFVQDNFLYATSAVDGCFYAIKLYDLNEYTNIALFNATPDGNRGNGSNWTPQWKGNSTRGNFTFFFNNNHSLVVASSFDNNATSQLDLSNNSFTSQVVNPNGRWTYLPTGGKNGSGAWDLNSRNGNTGTHLNYTYFGNKTPFYVEIAVYHRVNSAANNMVMASQYDTGTNNRQWAIFINSTDNIRLITSPDGVSTAGAGNQTWFINEDAWHHFVFIVTNYDRSLIYHNGTLISNQSFNGLHGSNLPVMIGGNLVSGVMNNEYNGTFDHFVMGLYQPSAEQIAEWSDAWWSGRPARLMHTETEENDNWNATLIASNTSQFVKAQYNFTIETFVPPADTCTYSGSGTWTITDNCIISSNVDVGDNQVIFNCPSYVVVTGSIFNVALDRTIGTCRRTVSGSGFIR
jgi:hypothetical protein